MKKEVSFMILIKKCTTAGLILGLTLLLTSTIVSDFNYSFISLGVAISFSSILLFGFGLLIGLLANLSNDNICKEDPIHSYQSY